MKKKPKRKAAVTDPFGMPLDDPRSLFGDNAPTCSKPIPLAHKRAPGRACGKKTVGHVDGLPRCAEHVPQDDAPADARTSTPKPKARPRAKRGAAIGHAVPAVGGPRRVLIRQSLGQGVGAVSPLEVLDSLLERFDKKAAAADRLLASAYKTLRAELEELIETLRGVEETYEDRDPDE